MRMLRFILVIVLFFTLAELSACYSVPTGDTASLAGLRNFTFTPYRGKKDTAGKNGIRRTAVQETAMSISAQAGLAWRGKQVNQRLEKETKKLDLTYNFQALLLQHNVLPPVLGRGDNTFNLASANSLRISDRTYKIEKQAHFVTTAPN